MRVKTVRTRDYVHVGKKHTQQINASDFDSVCLTDGWAWVTHGEGTTLIPPSTIVSVELEPLPSAPEVAEAVESAPAHESAPSTPEVKRGKVKAKQ
jgi:hypothetical protein